MRDFTIKQYKELLETFLQNDIKFQTFEEFLQKPLAKSVILRHDVDLLPKNSLLFAKIQNEYGIKGSYYFRAVPESWDEDIIKEVSNLGHEVGYHYETMDTANGDIDLAFKQFKQHLNELRELVKVKTICMHGSPRSPFDNKEIWTKYDYKNLGIIGEPYFDVNFNQVFYITDTGRRWDGYKVSVRDKVKTSFRQTYHSTNQIIEDIKGNVFPDKVMFTFHPQRWHDQLNKWIVEYILQNFKNTVKRLFVVK